MYYFIKKQVIKIIKVINYQIYVTNYQICANISFLVKIKLLFSFFTDNYNLFQYYIFQIFLC